MIDDDEFSYSPSKLYQWKDTAEKIASVEALGYLVRKARSFDDLERKAPALIAEMREDLSRNSLVRQFIVLKRGITISMHTTPLFVYHPDDHPNIMSVMTIMSHYGAIYDVAFNNVPRYNMNEDFVDYLIGNQ